jgi:hypothetical protein
MGRAKVWAEMGMLVEHKGRSTGVGEIVDILPDDQLLVDTGGGELEAWDATRTIISPTHEGPVHKLTDHEVANWRTDRASRLQKRRTA